MCLNVYTYISLNVLNSKIFIKYNIFNTRGHKHYTKREKWANYKGGMINDQLITVCYKL